MLLLPMCSMTAFAQYDFLRPVKGEIPGGYDFWVYTPTDYYYSLESTPVIMSCVVARLLQFLHNRLRLLHRHRSGKTVNVQSPGRNWMFKPVSVTGKQTTVRRAMTATRTCCFFLCRGWQ